MLYSELAVPAFLLMSVLLIAVAMLGFALLIPWVRKGL
jgi:hypothetical protein